MKRIFTLTLLLASFLTASAQLSFESAGNYGKLWDITYDRLIPNRLYARTLVNHIMVSSNNGASWNILYSFPNSRATIDLLKLLPGSRYLSFAVNTHHDPEQNGIYILDLWSRTIHQHYKLPNRYLMPAIRSYNIYNETAETVLVNTSYSIGFTPYTEVYYTKNAPGEDWKMIYFSEDYNTVHINNTAISPDNPSRLFLTRGNGATGIDGGLFISDDEGTTWSEQLKGVVVDPLEFNPRNSREFFIGTGISFGQTPEALYHTRDGGKTFEQIPVKWTDQTLNNITAIKYDPLNIRNMWMLEDNEILKSTDGGRTWNSTVFGPDSEAYTYGTSISVNPWNNRQLVICSDAWPKYSRDGGKTLSQLQNPFHVASSVAIGDYPRKQQLFYSTLGGFLSADLSGHKAKAYEIQSPFMVNVREQQLTTDPTIQGRLFTFKPGNGWVAQSELRYSNDNGATFTSLPAEPYTTSILIRKDPDRRNRYWLAYKAPGYSVLSLLDLTDPSNPVSTPVTAPGEGVISGIVVLPGNNGNHVYVTAGDKIFYTKDRGLTWSDKSAGLEGLGEIRDLQLNPLDRKTLAVATPQGVYMTKVGQDKWALSLADTDIRKIAFSDAANGHIIAASYTTDITDTKLVYTYDGGRLWREIPAEDLEYLQCTTAMDFRFYNNCADVYFATSDMGVVKYQMKGWYPHLLSEEANEKETRTEWSVFPVPATTNINLSVKGLTKGDSYFVSIIDFRGKQAGTKQYNFQAGTSTISIPVDHLQNGIYMMVVQPKVGEAQTFKFIKQ